VEQPGIYDSASRSLVLVGCPRGSGMKVLLDMDRVVISSCHDICSDPVAGPWP